MKWIEPNRFQNVLAQCAFSVNANPCALNWIECELGAQCEHTFKKELGRHRGREGKTECSLCENECENVSHVLWEHSTYSSTSASFMKKLQELL